ncbi:hypothetical protein AAMO2058_001076500 [Amorphochlora amoebiformis]
MMDILGHPYVMVHVNPISKEEISFSKDYKKVPIANVADDEIRGSDSIILRLHEEWEPYNKIAKGMEKGEFQDWVSFVDETLARPLFRATSLTWEDALKYTSYVREMESYPGYVRWFHHMVATAFTRVGSNRVAKKFKITNPDTDINNAINRFLDKCDENSGPFHGGTLPSLADVLVFGTLRSVGKFKAVQTLLERNERAKAWYSSMEEAAGESKAIIE